MCVSSCIIFRFAHSVTGNLRLVSAMPLSITPPEVATAGLIAAQIPAISATAANQGKEGVLQVLPGAVDMMLLFQVLCVCL